MLVVCLLARRDRVYMQGSGFRVEGVSSMVHPLLGSLCGRGCI